ncbi:hypothetical protein R5R35_011450 [Gryllus longicercus]|uniref:Uncharacterized protein n=1 Tax=Gryllus longicercus TaxID=2509291 RepID=A0AAN9YZX3_9ORTH
MFLHGLNGTGSPSTVTCHLAQQPVNLWKQQLQNSIRSRITKARRRQRRAKAAPPAPRAPARPKALAGWAGEQASERVSNLYAQPPPVSL